MPTSLPSLRQTLVELMQSADFSIESLPNKLQYVWVLVLATQEWSVFSQKTTVCNFLRAILLQKVRSLICQPSPVRVFWHSVQ